MAKKRTVQMDLFRQKVYSEDECVERGICPICKSPLDSVAEAIHRPYDDEPDCFLTIYCTNPKCEYSMECSR